MMARRRSGMLANSDTSETPARTTPTHICSFLGVDGALGDLLPADASSGPAPTTPRDRARLLDGRPHLQYTRSVERRTMRGSMTASHAKHSTAERPVRPVLTDRQRQALDYITECLSARGYPPTLREIGEHMGIRSTNGVNDHLKALER